MMRSIASNSFVRDAGSCSLWEWNRGRRLVSRDEVLVRVERVWSVILPWREMMSSKWWERGFMAPERRRARTVGIL